MRRMVLLFFASMLLAGGFPAHAGDAPEGVFGEEECVACHEKETPDIAAAWRAGPHGAASPRAGCASCHGAKHDGSAATARRPEACIACHGGADAAVVRSYLTSKHGVIATIERGVMDFSRSLSEANYRSPVCAYCHFHSGGHGVRGDTGDACLDCHSSRFAETLFESGRRGIDIGQAKMREAEEAVAAWRIGANPTTGEAAEFEAMLISMRDGPLTGLRLGTVHHSPDFQWWLGQAALDGALLRIKAALSRNLRRKALEAR